MRPCLNPSWSSCAREKRARRTPVTPKGGYRSLPRVAELWSKKVALANRKRNVVPAAFAEPPKGRPGTPFRLPPEGGSQ